MPKIVATEAQWIRKGIEHFSRSGAEGLVIEKMAAELGCSKSSFYWYFNNRYEFVKRLAEDWLEQTANRQMPADADHDSAEHSIDGLLFRMFSEAPRDDFLFYLRRLSMDEPIVRPIIERIERQRMKQISELLMKAGMPMETAVHKSGIIYHYYLGWHERHKHGRISEDDARQHARTLKEHLL